VKRQRMANSEKREGTNEGRMEGIEVNRAKR
jgi:hypothetical protein